MKALFHTIPVGGKFHRGKTPAGYPRTGESWQVFTKENKSRGICIEQHGFGNQRAIGHAYSIAPHETVFLLTD